jgi:hypothetical protein
MAPSNRGDHRVIVVRVLFVLAGIGLGAYGVSLLWEFDPKTLMNIGIWVAAGILLHDALFAPICVALGFAGRRLLPENWVGPVAVGSVTSVALILISVPVLFRGGAVAGNSSILDRDYPGGLSLALALVWVLVIAAVVTRYRPGRRPVGSVDGVGTAV